MVNISRFVLLLSTLGSIYGQDYFPPPDSEGGWRTLKDAAQIRKTAGMDLHQARLCLRLRRPAAASTAVFWWSGTATWSTRSITAREIAKPLPAMASVGKAYTSIACGIMLQGEARPDSRRPGNQGLHREVPARSLPAERSEKGRHQARASADHGLGHARRRRQSGLREFRAVRQARADPAPRAAPGTGSERACRRPCGRNPAAATRTPRNRRTLRRSCCATWSAWRCSSTSTRSWPSRWDGDRGATRCIAARTPCRTRPAAPTPPSAPPTWLRFGYLILHKGKWGKQQLVPAEYIEMAGKPSPYQKHAPFSLMFESQCRRPRCRRAARCVLQIGRRRLWNRGRFPRSIW